MKTKLLLMLMLLCMLGLVARAQVQSTVGSDADTWFNGATIYGADVLMDVRGGSTDRAGYLRFDLEALSVNTVLDAQLVLRNSGGASRNDAITSARFALYGLNNVAGNTPQDWDESTLTEDASGAEWTGPVPLDLTGGRLTNLDGDDGVAVTETFVDDPALDYWIAGNYTITITGQALVDFLQARAEDGGLATFIIANDDGSDRGFGIATKENTDEAFRPVLILTYIAGGAMNPQPADGSTITDLNLAEICWENMNVDRANIWFGAPVDANEINFKDVLTMIGTIDAPAANTCFPIPAGELPLAVPETYFWAVETYKYPDSDPNHLGEPNELIGNAIWQFSTSAIPVAQTNPADQFKFPAESASYDVQFQALTAITGAVWYKAGDPDTALDPGDADITVTITPDGGDLYTVSLTIDNVELADEGTYYCIAENDGGFSDPSALADLVVKRRLAYWAFEGDLTDAEGIYNATAADPNFAAGFTGAASSNGQALLLDGTTDFATLPEGFDNFKAGLTFIVWANPSTAAMWARFIDLGNGPGIDNIFLTRNGTSNTLTFNNNEGVVEIANTLSQNEWQMLVATMDETGAVVLYKNGVAVQTGTVGIPSVISRTLNFIGDSNYTSDALFAGLIDELQVYNYALTENAIADLYAGVYGNYCRYPDTTGAYDYNGNCVVDLPDFVEFASMWLKCGLYPNCE